MARKIIITEKQASVLKMLAPVKGKLRITQEQYDRLIASKLINENDGVSGGHNRVDKAFKKSFNGVDVENLAEEDFNIKRPNKDIPVLDKKVMNRGPIQEDIDGQFHSAVVNLIRDMYTNPARVGLDEYWKKNGTTWDEMSHYLTKVGLLNQTDNGYTIPKKVNETTFNNPNEAVKAIEDSLNVLLNKKRKMVNEFSGNYPDGVDDYTKNAPWNQVDDVRKESKNNYVAVIALNKEIAILEDKNHTKYTFYYYDSDKEEFKEYALGGDVYNIDSEAISNYVNDNFQTLSKGVGVEAFENGTQLVQIDDDLKNELLSIYDKDRGIVEALSSIQEQLENDFPVSEPMKNFRDSISNPFPKTEKSTPEKIKAALATIRAKELANREKPVTPVDETTSAGASSTGGSSGPFVGPLNQKPIRKEIPTVMETTVAGSSADGGSSGPYDANALPNIGRNGEFKKGGKTKAQASTQYPNGTFVETDSCTKLNNNKVAQNGGCSSGAVNNVVKQKKTSKSIISPSLDENTIKEVAKKTGKSISEVTRILTENEVKFNEFVLQVKEALKTLDSGDKIIDYLYTAKPLAFLKTNMNNGFSAEVTAQNLRDSWFGV